MKKTQNTCLSSLIQIQNKHSFFIYLLNTNPNAFAMNNFTFYSPTKFVFGRDAESKTGELAKHFGATRVLIVYGGGSIVRSGLLARVEASLEAAGISFVELPGVQPNPIDTKVREGIELGRKEGIDFILPIGGGSPIDTAKAIAVGIPYDGDFWDFYLGKAEPAAAVPVATVLTIPAAGSEGSGDSVITQKDGMNKLAIGTELLRPKFSIMNPEITFTLPASQTGYGITDMIAHILERYFTNTTSRVEGIGLEEIGEDYKIMILPDHPTPLSTKTHAGDPVPYMIYQKSKEKDSGVQSINEESAKATGIYLEEGYNLMKKFITK